MRRVRRANAEEGFTLVEMMIVVSIVAILASLTLPSVSKVMHTTKLTKTMAEIRTVAHAWDSLAGSLNQDEFFFTGETITVSTEFPVLVTAQELENLLEMDVPEFDSWGNLIEYRVDAFPSTRLLVRSANSDGVFDDEYVVGTEFSYVNQVIDLGITNSHRVIIGPTQLLQTDQVRIPVRELNLPQFVPTIAVPAGP